MIVRDLLPYSTVNVTLRAKNEDGWSDWSESAILTSDPAPPAQMPLLSITHVGKTIIKLGWTEPRANYKMVEGYQISLKNTDNGEVDFFSLGTVLNTTLPAQPGTL